MDTPPVVSVLGIGVTALSFDQQVALMTAWARRRDRGRVVCVANAHMLVEARRDSSFATILERADLTTPDGVPLVWLMRVRGAPAQERVAGMDLLPALCAAAERENIGVFFVGSTGRVLDAISQRLARDRPRIRVAGMVPLPFREQTPEEDAALVAGIAASQAGLVFVALGCPKQERWMHAHRGTIQAVMVGLGAAFGVFGQVEPRAPGLMRSLGLEWLFRLAREPRRLWKRYLATNPRFVWYVLLDLIRQRLVKTGVS